MHPTTDPRALSSAQQTAADPDLSRAVPSFFDFQDGFKNASQQYIDTLRQSNMAMENGPFMGNVPI